MASGLKWFIASLALSSLFLGGKHAVPFCRETLVEPDTQMRFDSSWGLVICSARLVMPGAAFNSFASETGPSSQHRELWQYP